MGDLPGGRSIKSKEEKEALCLGSLDSPRTNHPNSSASGKLGRVGNLEFRTMPGPGVKDQDEKEGRIYQLNVAMRKAVPQGLAGFVSVVRDSFPNTHTRLKIIFKKKQTKVSKWK